MRKIATPLIVLGLIACFAIPAMAGSLVTEPFTYSDGNLTPNGGWAVYSGTPPTDIQILTGRAVGNQANAPDDHILFTPQLIDVKTYACFKVKITDPGSAPKAVYFALLKDAGTANFVSRVYVLPLIAGGWTFGISHSSTNTTTASITPWSSTSLTYGQEYQVVINYNPVAHTSTLWVDPVNESSTNVTDTNVAIAALAVSGFGLRQSSTASAFITNAIFNAGTANWVYSVDDLGVGQSMADACGGGVVPVDRSTWGTLKQIYRR
jgi:hypothetical protein